MKTKTYIVEFNKLRFGKNEITFPIGSNLYEEVADKPFESANAQCDITLYKKENIYEMQFKITGNVHITCDTCLDEFDLPINKTYDLLIKLIDGPENLNDDEIIYLPKGLHVFDFKQFIYDYFILAIPTKISCEDAGKVHNQAFIDKLIINEGGDKVKESPESDPRWDALKNIYNIN